MWWWIFGIFFFIKKKNSKSWQKALSPSLSRFFLFFSLLFFSFLFFSFLFLHRNKTNSPFLHDHHLQALAHHHLLLPLLAKQQQQQLQAESRGSSGELLTVSSSDLVSPAISKLFRWQTEAYSLVNLNP